MTEQPDLSGASREALLAYIETLETTVHALQQQVGELERRLGGGGKRMPGLKSAGEVRSKATGQPRKPRVQGFARHRMALPTRREEHAASAGPDCGTRLAGGWVQRRREVIDLPVATGEVVEHVYLARQCAICGRRVVPAVNLGEKVTGKQRFGARLVSVIATLREVGRLPVRTIQWLLRRLHGVTVSTGSIVAASHTVAARGGAALDQIRAAVRASPVVHADETGWRENGQNGYGWTYCTATERYVVRGNRSKAVVDAVLGDAFAGVLCSDFYAAYHHYDGPKQRCWAHLLRDIHDLTVLYPADAILAAWAQDVRQLYEQAVAFCDGDLRGGRAAQTAYEQRLLACCQPFVADPRAVHAKLCRRIERHLTELFVFIGTPAVPPDNNAAERSLRPLVTARTISGGTRSPHGSATKMATASLFGTWSVRGLDPFDQCQQLLTAPQL